MSKELTQELLQSRYEYRDGLLYWKKNHSNCKIGELVGAINGLGYYTTRVNGITYPVHRLIFMFHNGYLPEVVDHIDGNPLNNKIENLRSANYLTNKYNQKDYKNNTSGHKGVYWSKEHQMWKTQINFNGKRKHLGYFNDLLDASEFVALARDMVHGSFVRGTACI